MVGCDSSSWSPDDTIRVLIASDIHLGYLENDPVRGEDSFIAFEEVLAQAVQYDVDLILLGGDLFHHSKPSPNCMYKCTNIVRKYCFGDKPVAVELLSDQIKNFSRNINYEDPNLNVSYPILSIHGNHDDPVGQASISSLDILSIGGLVNYFGKWTDYSQVRISPVLLQKGDTRLALYGLSHLKDQRLSRLFQEKKVEMVREEEHDWFNLLVLHQNRADRGPGNFIREDILPTFLDMVVWGHEHDCEIMPMKGSKEPDHFCVVQPGSTVATSLAAGEARPKHCALLQIHKTDFILTPLPLKTVRPFIFKTIVLSEENLGQGDGNENEIVQEVLTQRVKEAIEEARNLQSGDPKQPSVPLIRFNVLYEREEQNFNRIRFGQNFSGVIANSNDMIVMKRDKKVRERRAADSVGDGDVDVAAEAVEATDVEALLHAYFEALPPERRPGTLPVRLITEAVRDFTIKQNEEVLRTALEGHRRRCIAKLLESTAETHEEVVDIMRAYRDEVDAADAQTLAALATVPVPDKTIELSSDDEMLVEPAARGRGRGSRGPRGGRARGGRGRARGRAEPEPAAMSPTPDPPERRTPRRMAAQKSATLLQAIIDNPRRRRASSDIDDMD